MQTLYHMVITMKKKLIKIAAFLVLIGLFCYCFFVVAPGKETVAKPYDNSYKTTDFSIADYPAVTAEQADLKDMHLKDMHLIEKNDRYALYLDSSLSDIALVDIKTGRTYHSNPLRRDPELVLGEANRYEMTSLLTVDYINTAGTAGTFSSAEHALKHNQVWVKKIENGIRLTYQMGSAEATRLLPPVLTEATYEKLMEKLSESNRETVSEYYRYLESDNLPSDQAEEIKAQVPGISNQNLYLIRTLNINQKKRLESILTKAGFTTEEMDAEKEATEYAGDANNISFVVPVEFRLEEEGLAVSIPAAELQMPKSTKIQQINLLKGFLASDEAEGYLLMSDGSGTLLDRVGSSSTDIFAKTLYGRDETTAAPFLNGTSEQAVMPFFGQRAGKDTLLGYVTEGAPQATLIARQISDSSKLAMIYPSFKITDIDYKTYDSVTNEQTGIVLAENTVTDTLTVCYLPMEQDDATYSDMAVRCREFLLKQGILQKQESQTTPFYLSLIGTVEKEITRFGIPTTVKEPLTTFEQATEMLETLRKAGVSDITVEYAGITGEGMFSSSGGTFRPISELGGKDGYQTFLTQAISNGVRVFTAEEFVCMYQSGGLFGNQSAARKISKQLASSANWNPVTLKRDKEMTYLLRSPALISELGATFLKEYEPYQGAGISASSIGTLLYSDYKKSSFVSRTAAEQYYEALLESFQAADREVMVHTGNSYVLPYTSDILELPVGSSGEHMETEAIPFVQQVLHGYVNYSATPFNRTSDSRQELLKAIETGGAIYYQWIYAEDEKIYNTDLQTLYSLHYQSWIDEAVAFCKETAPLFERIAGKAIQNHQKLQQNVYATEYEGGITVIVNYGSEAVEIEGVSVAANGFAVTEGNGNAK